MKITYRGLIDPNGRIRTGGCGACGQRRLISSGSVTFKDHDSTWFNGMEYRFAIGQTKDVPDEVAEHLLKKYSYRNGMKLMAYERA